MMVATDGIGGAFANPRIVKQGWYVVGTSRGLRGKHPIPVEIGSRRLVAYRDASKRARVTNDRCPHLGSDLALADVTASGLRCVFHGWCWNEEGRCVEAPGNDPLPARRLATYPTEERWGLVWVWIGDGRPAFDLPPPPDGLPHRLRLLPQTVKAHAEVIFSNVYDGAHFASSHDVEASTISLDVDGPWRIAHAVGGRLPRRAHLVPLGLSDTPVEATFTQHGGGILIVDVRKPLKYAVYFTIRPDAEGHARCRTTLFLRRRIDVPRAAALLWSFVISDIPLMETIRWTGAYAAGDDVLKAYARFVEAMPAW